jgi:translation initiation factor IF-2
LATVRIYKVAELLNTTSQEVVALLKRDHGIEVKSASSTIEEVVGRQFVDRLARQRGITLPSGDIFAEGAAAKAAPKKPGLVKKGAAEPPKPATPTLGPPRLIKAAKAIHQAERAAAAAQAEDAEAAAAVAELGDADHEVFEAAAPAPELLEPAAATTDDAVAEVDVPAAEAPAGELVDEPAVATGAPEPTAAPEHAPERAAPAAEAAPTRQAPAAPLPSGVVHQPSGRVVPPSIRLRIEDPNAPVQPRPAARPAPPRPAAPQPGAPSIMGPASRTGTPTVAPPRPGVLPPRPAPPSGPRPSYQTPASLGGPRPLPSQPIRPQQPGMGARPGMPSRPGMPGGGARPGQPGGWRPSSQRPVGGRRMARPEAPRGPVAPAVPPPITKSITLAEGMTVKDLADKLEARVKDVLKKLLEQGKMMTINSTVDSDTATALAREFGADVQMRTFEEELVDVDTGETSPEDVGARAPVVTVMGHVDHGKTTLLDAIRETRVAEREAGGITQHIGAYHVTVGDRSVVFLDTPGHEAFTMMRSRGAKVTDIVVLVVAADDGVMPQTREAVNHAKAANVPIVVAVNKIDKVGANPDNVKRELAELGLVPEAWGGSTVMVDVSAKKRQNLELLLEMILLSSDILELKANPKKPAMGTVLEAKLDKGRGPVATVLVQDGTLRVGDNFIAGSMVGKVRALIDDRGRATKAAGPSTPVEVLGLTGLPQPGDTFQSVADPVKARQIALFRQEQAKTKALGAKGGRLTIESLRDAISEGSVKDLPLIVKADVQGSAEVLADSLLKLSDDKVKIKIIHSGVGAINESDVALASASNAIVIGFNVRPDRNAAEAAERDEVDIRHHSVIYNVTEEIKQAMLGLLEPTFKEQRVGAAQVRELFKVPKLGTIAGCVVTEGRIIRSGDSQARLVRDNVVLFEGRISSLRRFKDDVSEVKAGMECGIGFDRFNDLKVGDIIEVFVVEKVAPVTA